MFGVPKVYLSEEKLGFAVSEKGTVEPLVIRPYFQVKDRTDVIEVVYGMEAAIGKKKIEELPRLFYEIVLPTPDNVGDFDGSDNYGRMARHLRETNSYKALMLETEDIKENLINEILSDRK